MKIVSLLLSIAAHIVIVILFYIVITYEHRTIKTPTKVYSVNLITYQQHKRTAVHIKKSAIKVPKHKVKIKPKIKKKVPKTVIHKPKQKPKLKPKNSLKHKNNLYKKRIEEKIRQMRNREMREKIEADIRNMRENISKNSSDKLKAQAVHKYGNLVSRIIHSNWYIDTSLIKNQHLITKLDIRLDYKGNIIYIGIVKYSGNSYFDRSTIRAAKRSDPLPKPPVNLLNSGYIEFVVKFDSREKL